MGWLILVGGVWKPHKLTKFGLKFCPQGFRGLCGSGGFSGAASRNLYRRESKPLVAPRVQTPGDKILDQILSVWVVFRPLRPRWATPSYHKIWDFTREFKSLYLFQVWITPPIPVFSACTCSQPTRKSKSSCTNTFYPLQSRCPGVQVPRCWASSSFNENINWCVPQICSRKQKGTWRQLSEKVWGFKWVSWRQDHLWPSPTTTNRFLLLCTITSSANIRPTKCLFYGSSHFNISATKPWEHQAAGRSD